MSASEKKRAWFAALCCAFAGVAVFQFYGNATRGYIDTASMFYWWGYQWFDDRSETQHGLVVVAVSGWLLWRNLQRTDPSIAAPAPSVQAAAGAWLPAFVALIAGLALHALGFAAQQTRVSTIAFLVFTWGIVRLGGGRRWGAAALFPLGFLVFAIPLNALDSLGFWLRLWVIKASAGLAHTAGIGVVRNGTQLLAPDGRYNYDVAAACSGVRSLMALAALSLLLGYLEFRGWWRRAAMLLLCFPLVYLGNVVRISTIVFAAQWGGPTWGGRVHEWFGFIVFIVVLGGVLATSAAFRRWWPERAADSRRPTSSQDRVCSWSAADRPDAAGSGSWVGTSTTVALAVAAITVGEMTFLHRLTTLPPHGEAGVLLEADGRNPVELPAILGREWVGLPAPVTEVERSILPPDTGYSRINYVASRDRPPVFLSVVLSGRDRTSIHRPELCLLGQGWTIAGVAAHRFGYPGHVDAEFPATVLSVRREEVNSRGRQIVPQLVAYWFVGDDAVVATHWQRLALDSWNRVAHARADRWAYVLIQTDASDGEPAALARMQAVLDATLPAFQRPKGAR